MLLGYMLSLGFSSRECWQELMAYWPHTTMVDEWFARIGSAEMVHHRFLSEDSQLEQTEFAIGAAIAVNFADEPREGDGVCVPALGYVIRG